MRRALLVILTFVGTAACSYVFDLPSTAVLPTEGDGADAESDAPVYDGPTRIDAPPPIPFCATQAGPFLYCNDFDTDATADVASIGTTEILAGGQLVLSNAVAFSVPRSLLASVRGAGSAATVRRTLETTPDAVTLSFQQLVSAWSSPATTVAELGFVTGTTECTVRASGTDATWTLVQVCREGGVEAANTTTDTTSAIIRGRWQRFALSVAFAPTATVTLEIDGARTSVAAVAPLQRGTTSIALGARTVPDGSATLFQDDVLVTSP